MPQNPQKRYLDESEFDISTGISSGAEVSTTRKSSSGKVYLDIPTASESGRLATGSGAQISRGRTFFERALGAAPEIGGSIGGGIIGALAGGPFGAILGGTIGGAGGRSVKEIGAKTGVAPRAFGDPGDRLETAERIGMSGLYGGAQEALGLGMGRLGGWVAPKLGRRLTAEQARDIAILEREKIPYTAGDIRPEGVASITENLMRGTLFGGRRMRQLSNKQAQTLERFEADVLSKIGPLLSKEESGQALQAAVESRADKLFGASGVFHRAYQKAAKIYPAKIDADKVRQQVAPIKAELDALTQEGRIGASAKSKESPSRFIDIVERLASYGQKTQPPSAASAILGPSGQPIVAAMPAKKVDIPLTYGDVWQDKQALDAVIRSMGADDPLRTKAKALLARLHSILDSAMEDAAQKLNPKAAQQISQINAAYRNSKQLFETEGVVPRLRELHEPEKAVGMIAQRGSVTSPAEVIRAVGAGPQGQRAMEVTRRRVVENLFEELRKPVEGGTTVSGKQLEKRLGQMYDTLKALKTPQSQLDSLKEFVNAANRAQMSGQMINPASGRQLLAYGQLGQAATLGAGGALAITGQQGPGMTTAAAALFGPAVLARALTNPSMARFLAKGFSIRPGTMEAAIWIPRAINALRAIEQEKEE